MSSDTINKGENDSEFCKEIAKRAVARAALHLGVESMNVDALEVMGDALLSYLDTVRILNISSTRFRNNCTFPSNDCHHFLVRSNTCSEC